MKKPEGRPLVSESELSRLFTLALAVVEDRSRAENVIVRVISEAAVQSNPDERLVATLEAALADRTANGQTAPPPLPKQVPASDARGDYGEQLLSPDEWESLWAALTTGASDDDLAGALAALEASERSVPVTDEDIP
jgi:hypothetical protein